MLKFRHYVGICSVALGFTACGAKSPSSDESTLALTNAIAIGEDEYPAVVMLYRPEQTSSVYCTGVFINDHQALTAAHCLGEGGAEQQAIYYVRPDSNAERKITPVARALRSYVHDRYDATQRTEISPYDIALLDFPSGTAPGVLKLGRQSPSLNAKVTLVGYGSQESEKSGIQGASTIGDKRYGSNTIKTSERGLLGLSGLSRSRQSFPLGQHVASAQGDSGSPWLIDGQLSSITIGGEIKQMGQGQELSFTYAVDLNSESSRSFLSSLVF